MRSPSLPTCSYPPPRALRGLAASKKVPGAAPLPQLHVRRDRQPCTTPSREEARKQRQGDFRPGAVHWEAVRPPSEALLPLVLKPQVPSVGQPKKPSGALTSQRGELGLQASASRQSSRRDLLSRLVPVPELTGPLPQLCPLPSLSYSAGPQHPQSLRSPGEAATVDFLRTCPHQQAVSSRTLIFPMSAFSNTEITNPDIHKSQKDHSNVCRDPCERVYKSGEWGQLSLVSLISAMWTGAGCFQIFPLSQGSPNSRFQHGKPSQT